MVKPLSHGIEVVSHETIIDKRMLSLLLVSPLPPLLTPGLWLGVVLNEGLEGWGWGELAV